MNRMHLLRLRHATAAAVFLLLGIGPTFAQNPADANYDETRIAPYTLVDPLRTVAGKAVTTPREWETLRRPEIVRLFEENVFGQTPEAANRAKARVTVVERDDHALNNTAIREQVDLSFDPVAGAAPDTEALHTLRLLVYLPVSAAQHPVPVVLGLNFEGNQSVLDDPAIQPTPVWSKMRAALAPKHELPAETTRGHDAERWQIRLALSRGYGVATFYYQDLEPDFKDSAQYSVRNLFRMPGDPELSSPRSKPDEWGAIAAWAWGLSRAMDWLDASPLVNKAHVAVTGFSRLGKAADWAFAQDPRFAALLSVESGHGGQTIQRRAFGEPVAHLEHSFPEWFCPGYARWVGRDSEIPADGNLLLSLAAPRALYASSAVGDEYSDPHGEFIAAVSASRVYRLLGKQALAENTAMPPLDHPVGLGGDVAYHIRTGKHDVTRFDWESYLAFLDDRWGKPGAAPPQGAPPPAAPAKPASKAQVETWRTQMREALFIPEPLPKPATEVYSSREITPGVTIDKVSYVSAYGLRVPAVIYRPTTSPAKRLPAIVVVNGHGGDKSSWYAYYTGVLYARAGAVVLTYDPIGEGERNDEHKDFTSEHDKLVPEPASMPARMGGLMVTDVMQAVSTLLARPDVDAKRIAVMGFSMGSFVSSLAGAADPRIHALLLVGGGDLDGVGGYWDASHAVMCQSGPYKALLPFMPDRPADLFTLSARRGDTLILNGTADTVVDIPHHGPEFFAALRERTTALNGSGRGVFTTIFDPGASHRPSWIAAPAASWLNAELHFPAWKGKAVDQLPTVTIRDWATRVSFPLGKSSGREDRDAGIRALEAQVPLLTAEQLDVLPRSEWERRKAEFVYATWVQRATEAAR